MQDLAEVDASRETRRAHERKKELWKLLNAAERAVFMQLRSAPAQLAVFVALPAAERRQCADVSAKERELVLAPGAPDTPADTRYFLVKMDDAGRKALTVLPAPQVAQFFALEHDQLGHLGGAHKGGDHRAAFLALSAAHREVFMSLPLPPPKLVRSKAQLLRRKLKGAALAVCAAQRAPGDEGDAPSSDASSSSSSSSSSDEEAGAVGGDPRGDSAAVLTGLRFLHLPPLPRETERCLRRDGATVRLARARALCAEAAAEAREGGRGGLRRALHKATEGARCAASCGARRESAGAAAADRLVAALGDACGKVQGRAQRRGRSGVVGQCPQSAARGAARALQRCVATAGRLGALVARAFLSSDDVGGADDARRLRSLLARTLKSAEGRAAAAAVLAASRSPAVALEMRDAVGLGAGGADRSNEALDGGSYEFEDPAAELEQAAALARAMAAMAAADEDEDAVAERGGAGGSPGTADEDGGGGEQAGGAALGSPSLLPPPLGPGYMALAAASLDALAQLHCVRARCLLRLLAQPMEVAAALVVGGACTSSAEAAHASAAALLRAVAAAAAAALAALRAARAAVSAHERIGAAVSPGTAAAPSPPFQPAAAARACCALGLATEVAAAATSVARAAVAQATAVACAALAVARGGAMHLSMAAAVAAEAARAPMPVQRGGLAALLQDRNDAPDPAAQAADAAATAAAAVAVADAYPCNWVGAGREWAAAEDEAFRAAQAAMRLLRGQAAHASVGCAGGALGLATGQPRRPEPARRFGTAQSSKWKALLRRHCAERAAKGGGGGGGGSGSAKAAALSVAAAALRKHKADQQRASEESQERQSLQAPAQSEDEAAAVFGASAARTTPCSIWQRKPKTVRAPMLGGAAVGSWAVRDGGSTALSDALDAEQQAALEAALLKELPGDAQVRLSTHRRATERAQLNADVRHRAARRASLVRRGLRRDSSLQVGAWKERRKATAAGATKTSDAGGMELELQFGQPQLRRPATAPLGGGSGLARRPEKSASHGSSLAARAAAAEDGPRRHVASPTKARKGGLQETPLGTWAGGHAPVVRPHLMHLHGGAFTVSSALQLVRGDLGRLPSASAAAAAATIAATTAAAPASAATARAAERAVERNRDAAGKAALTAAAGAAASARFEATQTSRPEARAPWELLLEMVPELPRDAKPRQRKPRGKRADHGSSCSFLNSFVDSNRRTDNARLGAV